MPEDSVVNEASVKVSKDVEEAKYVSLLSSDLREEYAALRKSYKASRNCCKTVTERKMVMQAYADDVIDLAVEARLIGEWELNRALNQLCDSLQRRTYTGKRGW